MDENKKSEHKNFRPKATEMMGPLFESDTFRDLKDPCGVFDGTRWHIFGSAGSVANETWRVLHAVADDFRGPWVEKTPELIGLAGEHVAAPGVIFEKETGLFHMFIQTDFMAIGSGIEYLISSDGGETFHYIGQVLGPVADSGEAGLYDPHPAIIHGKKYLVYSGTPKVQHLEGRFVSEPNIYLAKSVTNVWAGPWKRVCKILDHADIKSHHNQVGQHEYEWGIEGAQLVKLPSGDVLLNATCFLAEGGFGTRQRVFFAVAQSPIGPYTTLCPVIEAEKFGLDDKTNIWQSGENGHATVVVKPEMNGENIGEPELLLFYQARPHPESGLPVNWRYGIARFDIRDII